VSTGERPARLPSLLVLGAPKAGTTTLAAWWAAHPRGFVPPEKEVRYFNEHHERGQAWYRSRFAGMGDDQVGCDATPVYLYAAHALDRIAEEVPGARLVVLLREPVARMWSQWCYFTWLGLERRPFAEVVLDAEARCGRDGGDYAVFSRYVGHLRAIEDRFDRSQLLVLFSDELRADRQGVFDRLADHAGVERAPLPDLADRNVGRFPRSAFAQTVLLRTRVHRLPFDLGSRLVALNTRPSGPPPLDPAVAARLRPLFTGELEALASWLGRPLPAGWQD
jgi:hypothetical protein